MRRAQDFAKMMGDGPRPRGVGDNNRGRMEPQQVVNKVFQRYRGAQQNPPGYGEGCTVPFNIDEEGMPNGSHY